MIKQLTDDVSVWRTPTHGDMRTVCKVSKHSIVLVISEPVKHWFAHVLLSCGNTGFINRSYLRNIK